jgi:hypothetical protein
MGPDDQQVGRLFADLVQDFVADLADPHFAADGFAAFEAAAEALELLRGQPLDLVRGELGAALDLFVGEDEQRLQVELSALPAIDEPETSAEAFLGQGREVDRGQDPPRRQA